MLEENEPKGTEVIVESFTTGRTYDAYVDEDGCVRTEKNDATFNNDEYYVKTTKS